VICRVQNVKQDGKYPIVVVGKTLLTPGHPVLIDSVWKRSKDVSLEGLMNVSEVFNFVVESRSSLFVDGLEVSTLGQFCSGVDQIGSHYGSELVVDELKMDPNWPDVVAYSRSIKGN